MRRRTAYEHPLLMRLLALAGWALAVAAPALAGPAVADERPESHPPGRIRATPSPSTSPTDRDHEVEVIGAPIDPDAYRVGPGDRLALTIAGALAEPLSLTVDAEGGLVLPGAAGRVDLQGLTLRAARAAVARALRREFRDRPFALTLVRPRRFKVFVGGEVTRPGTYVASPTTRVAEIIERAGGVRQGGSERRVVVEGAGRRRLEADLVGFVRLGDRDRNPYLEGGDLVRVPVAIEFFSIFGGVSLPGSYELRPGETLADALRLAGGLVPGARPGSAEWRRLENGVLGAPRAIDLGDAAIAAETLRHGDAVVIPLVPGHGRAQGTVEVIGEVRYPGTFPIHPGADSAGDLIRRAGGWTEWANLDGARLLRELEPPTGGETRDRLATSGLEPTLPVERQVVRIEERDWPRQVRVDWQREPLEIDPAATLEDGDILYVPRLSGRVMVDGRVRTPGLVPWREGYRAEDYVELAGGFDRGADRKHLLVRRAAVSGEVAQVVRGTTIHDGDLIWVPERAPRSLWRLTRDAIAVLAQVATVIIVIDQALQ